MIDMIYDYYEQPANYPEEGQRMLCDGCHENEAVVFYTEIINGEKRCV